jgi:asparagine synthase (glutamine-hydrolysing)
MTAFAGILTFADRPLNKQTEEILCRALTARRRGRISVSRSRHALFIQPAAAVGAVDRPPRPFRGGQGLYAASARLANRDELGAVLGLSPGELARTNDAELLLSIVERPGDAGLARCVGAFAFALWDEEARCLTLGRDCLGNKALFYHRGRDFVAFATTPGVLLALPDVPRQIDEIALAHFLALNLDDGQCTLYRGIDRVPSRTVVRIDSAGAAHRKYWSPNFDAAPNLRDEDYIAQARALLDQAVAAAIKDTPNVAISLSGGLDSSAIAATAARLGVAQSITGFTLVPPAGMHVDFGPYKYVDERDKVAALARMYPHLDVRLITPATLLPVELDSTRFFAQTALPQVNPASDGPFSAVGDAAVAAGHRVLLVGVRGNHGLSWWGRLALPALLRAGMWRALHHELREAARQSQHSLARTLAREVLMPIMPAALSRAVNRFRGRDPDSVAQHSALNPAFVAEHQLARQWQADGFDSWFGVRGWTAAPHRAACLFDTYQIGRDLAAMSEELDGYEIRDPLADRRLLEFVLAVPEEKFRSAGIQRTFARRVLADRLPPEILNESRRGAQVVDWFCRLQVRRDAIAAEIERLDSSPLARCIIDVPRLKRLMTEWPADAQSAQVRRADYMLALARGVHVGQFIRWVEGANA